MAIVAGLLGFASSTTASAEPMNVLFLVADDLNSWLLGDTNRYAGKVVAPNIRRLAESGVVFNRAYTAAPVCSPSRTAMLSGVRPWQSGVYDNGVDMILPGMRPTSVRLAPETTMVEWEEKLPPKTVPRVPRGSGHMQVWIDACKSGGKANSDFASYAVRLAEVVQLGVIAQRSGLTIKWDSANTRITSHNELNQLLHPHVRKGWEYKA